MTLDARSPLTLAMSHDGAQRSPLGITRRLWQLAVLLAVLAGIGIRVWSVLGEGSRLNSDEAVQALMVVHLLDHGQLPAFYWGQWYGGTAELPLLAAVMWVVGRTSVAMQSVQFVEGLAQALLVWRMGLRLLDRPRAVLAGALVWAWPAAFLLVQGRPYLFYESTVVGGLIVLLMALRVVDRPADRWSWSVLGLAGGMAFWSSPQSLYYLLPAGLWLTARLRPAGLRRAWPAVPSFLLGVAPWLVANSLHGWRSLRPNDVLDGPADRLVALVTHGLPMSLGLRVPLSDQWLGAWAPVVYVAACLALAFAVRAVRSASLHLVMLLTFPVVYAAIPVLATVTNGRYFIFLGAPLALAVSSLTAGHLTRAAVLAGCTLLTIAGVARSPRNELRPTTAISDLLLARGVNHAYAGYWTAYKLDWESSEQVIATPFRRTRHFPYERAVASADRVAVIYNDWPGEQAGASALRAWLATGAARYQEQRAGGYTVFLLDRGLTRAELPPDTLGYP